jgi:dolichol-phosphate mannosyltransferase
MRKVWLVIPTFNESENVTNIIDKVFAVELEPKYDLNILIVDSKSPDKTYEIVESLKEKYNSLHLLIETKRGLGVAYDSGFEFALNKNADIIMQMDADLSHDPARIPALLKQISTGSHLAIGSRYMNGGFIPGNWPLKRVINSKVAKGLARKVGGLTNTVTDPTAGFRAIDSTALIESGFKAGKDNGYVMLIKMTDIFYRNDFRITEVPITFSDREFGESKIRFKDIKQFVFFCFKMRLKRNVKNNILVPAPQED